MPTGTPKEPGRRQNAFFCRPKWQGLSVSEFSTARALKSSIGVRLVFAAKSAIDCSGPGTRETWRAAGPFRQEHVTFGLRALGQTPGRTHGAAVYFASRVSYFTRFPAPRCHE